ncbi:MAG: hypothetical protein KDD69_05025 [Bdellovibrionales bacterium]|nr:hypothetical protein [Bdellovibrionales bacterium]
MSEGRAPVIPCVSARVGTIYTALKSSDGRWMVCEGVPEQFPPGEYREGSVLRAEVVPPPATHDGFSSDDDFFLLDFEESVRPTVLLESEVVVDGTLRHDGGWCVAAHFSGTSGWISPVSASEEVVDGPFKGWVRTIRGARPIFRLGDNEITVVCVRDHPDYWFVKRGDHCAFSCPPDGVEIVSAEIYQIDWRAGHSVLLPDASFEWDCVQHEWLKTSRGKVA